MRFRADQVTPGTAGVRLFQADPADDANHEIFVNNNVTPFRPKELTLDQVAYLGSNRFRVRAASAALLASSSAKTTSSPAAALGSPVTSTSNGTDAAQLAAALETQRQQSIDRAIDDLFGDA
jgi:hypothetical protein